MYSIFSSTYIICSYSCYFLVFRVPPIHLIHGISDGTVPTSSSTKLSVALQDLGVRTTRVSLIPGLGHHQIAMDLMEPSRRWHDVVMGEILSSIEQFL